MQGRNVPVYLPATKTTIVTPKPMAKLAFELNYKGLLTSRIELNDNEALIEFQTFEELRKCLYRWQLKETAANAALWEFLKNNVSIELVVHDVEKTATLQRQQQPYVPILRLDVSRIDEFCTLFYAAKFDKKI